MGSLILPPAGSVYVDANSVIYAVEKIEPYCSFLVPLWPAAQAGQVSIVTSELTWLETLVKPMRDGNAALELLFRAISDRAKFAWPRPPCRYGNRPRACAHWG